MTRIDRIPRRRALQIAASLASLRYFPEALASDDGPRVILRRLNALAWQPLKSDFFPPGLETKALYEDKAKNVSLSVVRYPKGYHEPRHYHKGCGHWIYFLSGRIEDPTEVYTPGTFVYAPPMNVHGPFTAERETEILLFIDGPFDVFGA